MGFNAAFHAAETARAQGIDLWGEQKTRFAAGLEFHAQYELGAAVPSWLCGGHVTLGTGGHWGGGDNTPPHPLRVPPPKTRHVLASRRPARSRNHTSRLGARAQYLQPSPRLCVRG